MKKMPIFSLSFGHYFIGTIENHLSEERIYMRKRLNPIPKTRERGLSPRRLLIKPWRNFVSCRSMWVHTCGAIWNQKIWPDDRAPATHKLYLWHIAPREVFPCETPKLTVERSLNETVTRTHLETRVERLIRSLAMPWKTLTLLLSRHSCVAIRTWQDN